LVVLGNSFILLVCLHLLLTSENLMLKQAVLILVLQPLQAVIQQSVWFSRAVASCYITPARCSDLQFVFLLDLWPF
jgi:hypothetical protein